MRSSQRSARSHRCCCTILAGFVFLGGLLLLGERARAGDLDDPTCSNLRDTRDALISLGVQSDMRQGPQWAADRLATDRISRIKRYLLTMEQVLFRCGSVPREITEGMAYRVNMPDPKPFHERRTFPLPVRKPAPPINLRSTLQ